MNFKYNNVYLNETAIVTGPYEANGPLGSYFDRSYDDLYFGTDSWEAAEAKLIEDSVDILLSKSSLIKSDIDIHISGDLLNQLVATNYAAKDIGIPLMGVYAACATSTLGLIIGANMVESGQVKNAICTVSSHNSSAEKQFRYPVEYGGPKRKTTTFTSTGGASALISSKKKGIRIESGTIGTVVDLGIKDVYNMGAVMAPAAARTLYEHLNANGRDTNYYDLILTGDLGIYGKEIFKDYLKKEYGIKLKNYEDAGCILYDRGSQPVYAGASGPACIPLVTYGYIFDKMHKKQYKKILMIGTGALHNTSMCNEKRTIPSIAHAISLEVIK
ncbi:MAG: stage V sporulation protein AD [Bacilli bacterium]|nr:stage V sporulation protein AD [Bacilli bacterium]